MLYALFLAIAILYNLWKFNKNREVLLSSLIEAKTSTHREMILSHHFYVFIFEGFLAYIVAHFLYEGEDGISLLGLGAVYLLLVSAGFFLYRYFIRYLEKHTKLSLQETFKRYLLKELRVNFAVVLLPILIYSAINITFQGNIYEEWGRLWFIGLLFNLIFVSVLTIVCTVIIMLKLIPNREISEPEYLEVINQRLQQINMSGMRVRWIETDIKNAFVVGLKLLFFSNQTMFLGKSLRTMLTLEEFDAVISHELAHVANRHIHKRLIDILKNFISVVIGAGSIMITVIGFSFVYWGDEAVLHTEATAILSVGTTMIWVLLNYALFFDTIRSHEYEADAYAVIKLGVPLTIMKSALEKLTLPEDLPDYLKNRSGRVDKSKSRKWLMKFFSTHPDLNSRLESLEKKVQRGLPFNYYVSSAQRIRKYLGHIFQWRVAVPLVLVFTFLTAWSVIRIKRGQELITWIQHANLEEIKKNLVVTDKINTSPTVIGPSLMFYIVKKGDSELIEHFIDRGADKGKTLMYISQLRDFGALQRFYLKHEGELSEDEYFLILRNAARANFVEGYRFLVNARRFEDLNPVYKEDVSRINQWNRRRPASVNKN